MDEDIDKPNVALARNAARNLLKIAKIAISPVKLVDVAKHVPDLDITGEELEDEISGMQGTYNGISFIRYNTNHSTKRNRFTVAHELGHAILGHTLDCGRGNFNTKDPREIEANQFAAELLMPLVILKKTIGTITTLDRLAKTFWVSKEAMYWRINDAKLLMKLTSMN